jgi:hypothetical protein
VTTTPVTTIEPFDLAFGIAVHLDGFARALNLVNQRRALIFLEWPDFMTTRNEQALMLARTNVFKDEFDFVLAQYFASVPDGQIHFNLGGMNADYPASLTVWELRRIVSSSGYLLRSRFYTFEGQALHQLGDEQADRLIDVILGVS